MYWLAVDYFRKKKPPLWILNKVLITPSCCSCVFIENMFDSWVMVEHLTKVFVRSEKSRKIHWKSPALEPLFNVTWFQLESSLKKRFRHMHFSMNFTKFFRSGFFAACQEAGQFFCKMPKIYLYYRFFFFFFNSPSVLLHFFMNWASNVA